jgi:predicted Rossmann-fold nucleotide-binding protein
MADKRDFKRICVFCGAGVGTDPVYEQGAVALGKELVARKIGLVYGGRCRHLI